MSDLVRRARIFAEMKHAAVVNEDGSIGQKRKYTGDDYIVHPREVVAILKEHGCSEEEVAAGWLHDVLEDTPCTIEEMLKEFGGPVTKIVWEVTDAPKFVGNGDTRHHFDVARRGLASAGGQNVSCADAISNTRNITHHDKDFARRYLPKKAAMLQVLDKARSSLRQLAWKTLREAQQELVQHALAPKGLILR